MVDTKLVRILRNMMNPLLPLSEKERLQHVQKITRKLKALMISPYFNTPDTVHRLFEFLMDFAPDFNDPALNEEEAFKYVFPEKVGDDFGNIRKLRNKLLGQVEKYIFLEEMMEGPWAEKLAMLRFLGKNKMLDEFYRHLNQEFYPALDSPDLPEGNQLYWRYLGAREVNNVKSAFQDDGRSGLYFQEASDSLDHYYLYQKLVYACQMLNRQNIVPLESAFQLGLLDEFRPFLEKELPFLQQPLFQIWITAFNMLRENEAGRLEWWNRLNDLLDEHFSLLSANAISLIYGYLQNNVRYITPDKEAQHRVYIRLFESQIDKEVFKNHFTLSSGSFYNTIQTYLLLDDIQGAETSFNRYKGILPVLGEDISDLCNAAIQFEKGNFSQALDILNGIQEFSNLHNNVKFRRLLLKTYFELGGEYISLAEDSVNAFRVYISRYADQLGELHSTANREFINITFKLLRMIPGKDRLTGLEAEIGAFPRLPERKWLLAKCRKPRKK